jgi:hypothetical protein
MIRVLGDSRLPREVVRRAERYHAQGDVAAVQAVHDLVERAVSPARDHDVRPAIRRLRGQVDAVAVSPRHAHVHGVSPLANPGHHVTQLRIVGAGAVHDERQVQPSWHRGGELGALQPRLPRAAL